MVHVAVAVIKDHSGRFLIAKRPQHLHQGGLWEFPGGKLEPGESVQQALIREVAEEVGLKVESLTPLIRINHDYGDKKVLLDAWCVDNYSGIASSNEGQELRWVYSEEFENYEFPSGNRGILKALTLPDIYMITGNFRDFNELQQRVLAGLNKGLKLIQFRAHHLDYDTYFNYAKKLYELCKQQEARLLLNVPHNTFTSYHAYKFSHGLHLTANELKLYSHDAGKTGYMLSASVHDIEELEYAENCSVDFIVISPVKETTSHPGEKALGWPGFNQLTEHTSIPVYALGGMVMDNLLTAKLNGGQGISAISEFWSE